MKTKPQSCNGCSLQHVGAGFSNPEGHCSNGVLIVGEALDSDGIAEGLPFPQFGRSGSMLERAFRQTGVKREQFALWNLVACCPPSERLAGEPYEASAIKQCSHHLKMVFDYYKPKVIVTLGSLATRALTGLSGDRQTLDMIRGFALDPADQSQFPDCVIIPSYSPIYIQAGNHALLLCLQRDLNFARHTADQIRKGTFQKPSLYKPNYKLHASDLDLKTLYDWLKNNPNHRLLFDFETVPERPEGAPIKLDKNGVELVEYDDLFHYRQQITQVNFSLGKGHALVADYQANTKGIIQDILTMTENPKAGHNIYHFDIPVARWNGFDVRGSRIDDTIWSFHALFPDLPGSKGGASSKRSSSADDDGALAPLQFCASMYGWPFPWKHLYKDDPHLYGAYDVDSNDWVLEGTFTDLIRFDCFRGYDLYVRRLRAELDRMERRGIAANVNGLKDLSAELLKELQTLSSQVQVQVPYDLKPLSPKDGYKKTPQALIKAISKTCSELGTKHDQYLSLLTDREVYKQQHEPEKLESLQWLVAEALKLQYRISPFDLYNSPCSCITTYLVDEPQHGCKLCADSGGLGSPTGFTRGAAKAAKCDCTKPKEGCSQCEGEGFYFKALKRESCKHEALDQTPGKKPGSIIISCADCKRKAVTCRLCVKPVSECPSCSGTGKVKVFTEKPCKCRQRSKPASDCQKCFGTGLRTGSELRWARILPFNFNSSKQVMAYAKAKNHQIPMNSKRKIAADKETLIKLAKKTKDPLYTLGIDIREVTKIRGAYCEGWLQRALNPETEFRCLNFSESTRKLFAAIQASNLLTVHTEFSYKPATGQLSSRSPNVQVSPNESKYGELAVKFRQNVEAPEGYHLLEADYSAFHVLTLGYEAQDESYIRLARLDTHSFLAANLLNLPGCQQALALPDAELAEYLNYVKTNYETTRNKQAKPAILGYGFGMGAVKLYELNPESFASLEQAKWTVDMLNSCFPKTAQYRKDAPEQAHRQGFLRTNFGCMRWFMNVKVFDSESGQWKHGRDWEKAIAFRPANNAFCVIKEAMIRMHDNGMADRYSMINNIHDALVFCVPNDLVEEANYNITEEMERPHPLLLSPSGEPFYCKTEVKLGQNWAKMKKIKKGDGVPKGTAMVTIPAEEFKGIHAESLEEVNEVSTEAISPIHSLQSI